MEDVVAVEGDVDGAQVGPLLAALDQQLDHALGQPGAARANADEVRVLPVALDDLEGEPPQDAGHADAVEDFGTFDQVAFGRRLGEASCPRVSCRGFRQAR